MNNLTNDLQSLVNIGVITEKDILLEINEIRKCQEPINYPNYNEPVELDETRYSSKEDPFWDNMWMLSDDAQTAISYILDLLNPMSVKHRIETILSKKFDWNKRYTFKVIREIKEYLRDIDSGLL